MKRKTLTAPHKPPRPAQPRPPKTGQRATEPAQGAPRLVLKGIPKGKRRK